MEKKVNPEIKEIFSYIPEVIYTQENLSAKRNEMYEMYAGIAGSLPINDAVLTSEKHVPGAKVDPDVRIKIYEPRVKDETLPGVLYIHGGGYILGSADMMDTALQQLVSDINCVIVSVDYRLAPEHPFPAPLEDCYAALKWFSENAEELGVDSSRIAVVGPSAGGGLTAAVSLLARDRKGPSVFFQMPLYPMIDDRNITKSIPTYTCVGDLDPFRDETIDYVLRLTQAGVPTEFHLYPGCFHGFEEYFPSAEISQRIVIGYNTALKRALHK